MGLTNSQLLNVIIIPTAVFLLILLVLATYICLKITNKWERQNNSRQRQEKVREKKILEETAQGVTQSKLDINKDKERRRSFRERTLKKDKNENNNGRSHLVSTSLGGSYIKDGSSMNGIENSVYVHEDTYTPSDVTIDQQQRTSEEFHYSSPKENPYSKNTHACKVDVHENRYVDDSSSNNSSTIINVKNESEISKRNGSASRFSSNELIRQDDDSGRNSTRSNHSETKTRQPLNHDELMRRSQKFLKDDLENAERYNHLPPLKPPTIDS